MSVTRALRVARTAALRLSHVPDKAMGGLHSENMVGEVEGELPVCLCSFPQATRRLYCGCSLEVRVGSGAGSAVVRR